MKKNLIVVILIRSLISAILTFILILLGSYLFYSPFFNKYLFGSNSLLLFIIIFFSNFTSILLYNFLSKVSNVEKNLQLQRSILEEMKDGLLVLDSNNNIIKINKEAETLLAFDNYKEKSANGKSLNSLIKDPHLLKLLTQDSGKDKIIEAALVQKNSSKVYLQISKTELSDSSSVLVLTDITRLKVLEKIRQDFVANVSHELKTPITSIVGFIETLQEGAIDNKEEAKRFLKIIDRQSQRLMAIIEDLLMLARIEGNESKNEVDLEVSIVKLCLLRAVDFVEQKASKKNISIKIDCPEDLNYGADWSLLEQAVTNLVVNAVKYSDENCNVLIKAYQTESHLKIAVKDEGHGIPQKSLDRIFERFYRIDKARSRTLGGTGLGLAIVKHVASIHGGSVEVESELEKGSTFTINLPVR